MTLFQDVWSRSHPALQPIGWMLRRDGAPNWVRFHSLPHSKRYADSDEERRTILHRQNTLATEVLTSERCWLVQNHWATPPGITDAAEAHDHFAAAQDWNLEFAFEFTDSDEDSALWRVHAVQTQWANGRFDDVLTSIAEDRAAPTLWVSETTGSIFAPYDGGVDLFLAKPEQVAVLQRNYGAWLSAHTGGL